MSSSLSEEIKRTLQEEMVERLSARSEFERKRLDEDLKFSQQLLLSNLYGKRTIRLLDRETIAPENNSPKSKKPRGMALNVTQNYDVRPTSQNSDSKSPQQSNAIRSFPPEVQLCMSSIPRAGYGVCSRRYIPTGTWIGPYEGKRVRVEEVTPSTNTAYMWEIFDNGRLDHYIDGSDENAASWMRFIRCARFKEEQNLFAFQYGGNVYYRAFRDIPMGEELLVWYDDKYPQHMGIPVGLQDMPFVPRSAFAPTREAHSTAHVMRGTSQPIPSLQASGKPCTQPLRPEPVIDVKTAENQAPTQGPYNAQVPTPPPTPTEVRSFPPPLTSASAQPQTRRTSIDDDARGQQHVAPGNSDIRADDAEASEVDAASPSWTQRGSPVEEMNSWKCQQCQKTFTQRILLQMHVCPCQPNRPYQCGRCSLSFANPSDLRAHVVSHVNEKPFKCGFCARAFAGATTLNNHIRTHTGQRPFNCDQCGKTFSQASMLARHQRNPGECIKAVPNGPNDAQQP